jgi:hypothetical protein
VYQSAYASLETGGLAGRNDVVTLDQLVAMTRAVLAEDGLEEYLPATFFPQRQEFRVLDGIPPEVEHTRALIETLERQGAFGSDFLFGVRSGTDTVMLGAFSGGKSTFVELVEGHDGFVERPASRPPWWPHFA